MSQVDQDLAYGPDDPGYGPPGPDWYQQDQREPEPAPAPAATSPGATSPGADGDEDRVLRSPFEPLRRSTDPSAAPPPIEDEMSPYVTVEYEETDIGDLDLDLDLSGLEGDPVTQLHGLYAVADTLGTGGSARQFDQLLERQRKLISEYFKETGGLGGAVAESPSAGAAKAAKAASAVEAPGADDGDALVGSGGDQRSGR